jgi:hypothetical protein
MLETSESVVRGAFNPEGVRKGCLAITDAGIGLQRYGSGILLGRSVSNTFRLAMPNTSTEHTIVFSESADVFHSSDGEPFTVFHVQWTVTRPLLPPVVSISCEIELL